MTGRIGPAAPLHLGPLLVAPPVLLSPMAGITDRTFRGICRELGCGYTCCEMVSARALVALHGTTRELIDIRPGDPPTGVQLLGRDPAVMAAAARIAAAAGAASVDINMGCPASKVVANGEGAALLLDQDLAARIVAAVAAAVPVPVTVKLRRGFDPEHETGLAVARAAVAAGAVAVTMHGRLRSEFFRGRADWSAIAAAAVDLPVPVIGNGDVDTPAAAAAMLAETGCAGVMIGRGALGNPWLFARTASFLEGGESGPASSPVQRLDLALRQLWAMVEAKGEARATAQMKGHMAWYVRGLPQSAALRAAVMSCRQAEELAAVLGSFRQRLAATDGG